MSSSSFSFYVKHKNKLYPIIDAKSAETVQDVIELFAQSLTGEVNWILYRNIEDLLVGKPLEEDLTLAEVGVDKNTVMFLVKEHRLGSRIAEATPYVDVDSDYRDSDGEEPGYPISTQDQVNI
ncbi:hypothetical protein Ddc_09253 [Ditylenchus destructor]|nr:hypothetical protein Ddc_09253 [Ditylenchus destructor]